MSYENEGRSRGRVRSSGSKGRRVPCLVDATHATDVVERPDTYYLQLTSSEGVDLGAYIGQGPPSTAKVQSIRPLVELPDPPTSTSRASNQQIRMILSRATRPSPRSHHTEFHDAWHQQRWLRQRWGNKADGKS